VKAGNRRSRTWLITLALIVALGAGLLAGRQLSPMGNTNSPNTPENTQSHTLEDVYDRLNTGAVGAQSTFTEPGVAPGTGTMHTIDEIMALIPDHKDSFDGADGVREIPIPDGIYKGSKTATANDSDLKAENILKGVEILGVAGTHERFDDHGDGAVTDNETGLMWTKDADNGAKLSWWNAAPYCLNCTTGGYNDWRFPEIWELYTLVDQRRSNPSLPEGHPFVGVHNDLYWTETKYEDYLLYAYYVRFSDGRVDWWNKDMAVGYVWCVRGP